MFHTWCLPGVGYGDVVLVDGEEEPDEIVLRDMCGEVIGEYFPDDLPEVRELVRTLWRLSTEDFEGMRGELTRSILMARARRLIGELGMDGDVNG